MIRIYVMLGMRLSSFLSISPVKLWVRNPFMARFTRCNFLWKCLSVTCSRSVVFSGYSGFLHQQNWPPQYNWIILESDVNVKPSPIYIILTLFGLIFRRIYIYIYIYVGNSVRSRSLSWQMFVFPRRDLNSHHWYTTAPIAYSYVQHPRPHGHIR
jgi:hypothetical protein